MKDTKYKVKYYDKNKTKKRYEIWHLNSKHHREDGPALINYYESGQIERECWYLNDLLHKKDEPAYIYYYENGQVFFEHWYLNGERHRKDGPAVIYYYRDGQVECEEWYLNDEELSEERIKQLKLEIEADKCIEEMLNE